MVFLLHSVTLIAGLALTSDEALPKSSDPRSVKFCKCIIDSSEFDWQDGKWRRRHVRPLQSFITPVDGLVHNVLESDADIPIALRMNDNSSTRRTTGRQIIAAKQLCSCLNSLSEVGKVAHDISVGNQKSCALAAEISQSQLGLGRPGIRTTSNRPVFLRSTCCWMAE